MSVLIVLGRVFLSLIFLLGGVFQIYDRVPSEQILVNGLLDLRSHIYEIPGIQNFFDQLIANSANLLTFGIILQLLGAFLVLLGIQVRLGAVLLILFLIPSTLIFHSFWLLEGSARELQMIMFFKNLSILGGCLILLGCHSKAHLNKNK